LIIIEREQKKKECSNQVYHVTRRPVTQSENLLLEQESQMAQQIIISFMFA